jgi:ATP synthase protein I
MAARRGGSDERGGVPSSDADLARRFDRLTRDLDVERRERVEAERPPPASAKGFGQAFRLASEFVAGVLVGAAIGWGIDYLAGTSPWGLIVFLLLGFCAGVVNVVRGSSRVATGGPKDGAD